MLTKFEGIPREFIIMYRAELETWARFFKRRGPVQRIELRVDPRVPVKMNPDPAQGRVIEYVTLVAMHQTEFFSGAQRMIIKPQTDEDREKIARHIVEMRAYVPLH